MRSGRQFYSKLVLAIWINLFLSLNVSWAEERPPMIAVSTPCSAELLQALAIGIVDVVPLYHREHEELELSALEMRLSDMRDCQYLVFDEANETSVDMLCRQRLAQHGVRPVNLCSDLRTPADRAVRLDQLNGVYGFLKTVIPAGKQGKLQENLRRLTRPPGDGEVNRLVHQ